MTCAEGNNGDHQNCGAVNSGDRNYKLWGSEISKRIDKDQTTFSPEICEVIYYNMKNKNNID